VHPWQVIDDRYLNVAIRRRLGTRATDSWSRGSISARAPDRSKRYALPVAAPTTVIDVIPVYWNTGLPADAAKEPDRVTSGPYDCLA
jgi:hypothetical protein